MLKNLNKKQKIELAVTAVGDIFLIFMVIGRTKGVRKLKETSLKEDTKSVSFFSAPISIGRTKAKQAAIKEDWKRDPFFPGSASISSDSGLAGFMLNGILWSEDSPYAIINNDIVTIGDIVDDAMILEINEDSVIVEQDDERYILKVDSI